MYKVLNTDCYDVDGISNHFKNDKLIEGNGNKNKYTSNIHVQFGC